MSLSFLPLLAAAIFDATETALDFVSLYERIAGGDLTLARLAEASVEDAALLSLRHALDDAKRTAIDLEMNLDRMDAEARKWVYDHPDAPPQTLPGGGQPSDE